MVALVQTMPDKPMTSSAHQHHAAANPRRPNPQVKTLLPRQIDATDRKRTPVRRLPFADALVYELYGLTDEEIAIVEKT